MHVLCKPIQEKLMCKSFEPVESSDRCHQQWHQEGFPYAISWMDKAPVQWVGLAHGLVVLTEQNFIIIAFVGKHIDCFLFLLLQCSTRPPDITRQLSLLTWDSVACSSSCAIPPWRGSSSNSSSSSMVSSPSYYQIYVKTTVPLKIFLPNILEYSGILWNILNFPPNILEYSGIFWNIPGLIGI